MVLRLIGEANNFANVSADFYSDEGSSLVRLADGSFGFVFNTGTLDANSNETGTISTLTLDAFGGASSAVTTLLGNFAGYLGQVDTTASSNGDYFVTWSAEPNSSFCPTPTGPS